MPPKNEPYIIYGRRPVQEFLRKVDGPEDVEIAYISESIAVSLRREISEIIPKNLQKAIPRKSIDKMFPNINHQGIVIRLRKSYSIKKNFDHRDWKSLIQAETGLIVLLDRIQDPFNTGNIIRTAEALGAVGVIITGRGASPGPTVDRASAGATMNIHHFQFQNADIVIDFAKSCGYWICSSAAMQDLDESMISDQQLHLLSTDLSVLPETEHILLVIGNEGGGIKDLILKKTDYFISIPLSGETSSLNAGTAAGILLDRIINR